MPQTPNMCYMSLGTHWLIYLCRERQHNNNKLQILRLEQRYSTKILPAFFPVVFPLSRRYNIKLQVKVWYDTLINLMIKTK